MKLPSKTRDPKFCHHKASGHAFVVPTHGAVKRGQIVQGRSDRRLTDNGDERSEVDQAKNWLLEALKDGPMDSPLILKEAKDNGFSEKTLRRAAAALKIKPKKWGFKDGWYWGLQDEEVQDGHQDPKMANSPL